MKGPRNNSEQIQDGRNSEQSQSHTQTFTVLLEEIENKGTCGEKSSAQARKGITGTSTLTLASSARH